MIMADRREGGIVLATPDTVAPLWRNLDRNSPLWLKLIVPVILVTLLGTGAFGVMDAVTTSNQLEASNYATATAAGQASANAFFYLSGDPMAVNQYLKDVASAQGNVRSIWIIDLALPGDPVVASSLKADTGRTDVMDGGEILLAELGRVNQEKLTIGGEP